MLHHFVIHQKKTEGQQDPNGDGWSRSECESAYRLLEGFPQTEELMSEQQISDKENEIWYSRPVSHLTGSAFITQYFAKRIWIALFR